MNLELIAHRGFSAIAPENTLAAFSAAITHQADAIEFDVQLSLDGIPVIIHDTTLKRTTNGTGKIQNKTLAQLKLLDAGSWFSSNFSGETIPTFQDVLNLMKPSHLHLYAEVKQADNWTDKNIDNLVQMILSQGWQDRCTIISFNDTFLRRTHQLYPQINLGYNIGEIEELEPKLEQIRTQKKPLLLSEYQILLTNPSLIATCKAQDVELVAWTVDSLEAYKSLVDLGIRRIISNSLVSNKLS